MSYPQNVQSISYEGWSNRETWAVALWLDNDCELRQLSGAVIECYRNEHVSFLASALRQFVLSRTVGENPSSTLEGAKSMVSSAGSYKALVNVNWREIAQNYLTRL